MKVSVEWLQKYLSKNVPVDDLSEIFVSIGLEVEGIEVIGLPRQDTLIVGEIQKIEKHPNADRLSVCNVCVGENDVRQIVCGAKNFKLMDHVPVALPGTTLPGGVKIEKSNFRGVESYGMMCSGRELGIGNDHSGLLILDNTTKVGACLHDVIDIQYDTVFDLSLTANRGDCLSYIGIARDVAAKLGIDLILPEIRKIGVKQDRPSGHFLEKIVVEDSNCSLYSAICIRNVKIDDSPEWMKKELISSGIRSISNIVDVGNWVMLETGQPVHIFDAKKIHGGELRIRPAIDGEKIVTLDGKERILNKNMMVISDSEMPLVIAGISGSVSAEVDDNTTDIIIEGAYFDPDNIRRSSRALNISTESSYRFSRDVDRSNVVNYACRVADLVLKICGGELVSDCWVVGDIDNQRISIPFSVKKIDDLCGFEIPVDLSRSSLERLGFSVSERNPYEWDVTVPSHRHDITCQADIVSECLRMYGADKIPSHDVIGVGLHDCNDASFNFTKNVSKYFSDHGFLECYNLSLRDHAESDRFCGVGSSICPKNPLNSDQDSFRNTLIFGLLDTLRCNIQNGNFDNGFYEVGRVVTKIEGKFNECLSVAFIKTENQLQRSWAKEDVFTFFDAKSLIMPILRNFSKRIAPFSDIENSKMWQNGYSGTCGFLNREKFHATCGMLNVDLVKEFGIKEHVIAAEIILSLDILKRKTEKITYKEYSKFPRISKDLSLIVNNDEKCSNIEDSVMKSLRKTTPKDINIESITFFDVYSGDGVPDGMKNIGMTINYRSDKRTLLDSEVQNCFNLLQDELSKSIKIRKLS